MGKGVLPFLRKLYDADASSYFPRKEYAANKPSDDLPLSIIKAHGLVFAVRDIIGDDFFIPDDIRGKTSEIEKYTKKWLDYNIQKYK